MNLKDFVGGQQAPQYLRRPFRLEITDQPWACASDSFAFVGVKADLKLSPFAGPADHLSLVQAWLQSEPVEPKVVKASELLEWSGPIGPEERLGVLLGIVVDRNRLTRIIQGLKGDLLVWPMGALVGVPALGFARGEIWRAVLAGHDKAETEVPVFDPTTAEDLFDLAMNA